LKTAAVRELALSNQPARTSKVGAHSETGRLIATTTRMMHMFLQPAAMIASHTVRDSWSCDGCARQPPSQLPTCRRVAC
jgi:hypothetical protein